MKLTELNTLDKVKQFINRNQFHYSHAKSRPVFQALELGFDEIFYYLFDIAEIQTRIDCVPFAARCGRIGPLRVAFSFNTADDRPLVYEASIGGYVDVLDFLVESGMSIDQPSKDGITPLMQAIEGRHYGFVERLLQLGANVHTVDKKGKKAIHRAVNNDLVGMVHLLFIAGSSPDLSMFHLVASSRKDRTEMLKCLIGYVNINEQNEHGYTALMLAVRAGVIDNVRLLLASEADINLVNKSGKTASFFAKGEMIDLFRS